MRISGWSGRMLVGVVAIGIGFCVPSGAADALAPWSEPLEVSLHNEHCNSPRLASDSGGRSTASWLRYEDGVFSVVASSSVNGGAWSNPVDVSPAGHTTSEAVLAVDTLDRTIAVWLASIDGTLIVQSSTSVAGASWSAPVNLSQADQNAVNVEVATDGHGRTTAVWTRWDGFSSLLQSSSTVDGVSWTPPVNLSKLGSDVSYPLIVADSRGRTTAVWSAFDGSNTVLRSSSSVDGGAWSEAAPVSLAGSDASSADVAADSDGRVTAVWNSDVESNAVVFESHSVNGASWSTPTQISSDGFDTSVPQVAGGADGQTVAIWLTAEDGHTGVTTRTSTRGGAWSSPTRLTPLEQDAGNPKVNVDSAGRPVAVWTISDGSDSLIQTRRSNDALSWTAPVNVSVAGPTAVYPRISTDASGRTTVVWVSFVDVFDPVILASSIVYPIPSPAITEVTALAETGVDLSAVGAIVLSLLFAASALRIASRRSSRS